MQYMRHCGTWLQMCTVWLSMLLLSKSLWSLCTQPVSGLDPAAGSWGREEEAGPAAEGGQKVVALRASLQQTPHSGSVNKDQTGLSRFLTRSHPPPHPPPPPCWGGRQAGLMGSGQHHQIHCIWSQLLLSNTSRNIQFHCDWEAEAQTMMSWWWEDECDCVTVAGD